MISLCSKTNNVKKAFALFDELVEKGLEPNVHTYSALLHVLYKSGKMEAAEELLKKIQSNGININRVICTTMIGGYSKKGMIEEAQKFKMLWKRKGISI